MAQVKTIDQHDYILQTVTFSDGASMRMTWSRSGLNVTVKPADRTRSERLSLILERANRRTSEKGYPFNSIGDLVKAVAGVAGASDQPDSFLDQLTKTFDVSDARPQPRNAQNALGKTTASLSVKRGGQILDATFANGERLTLKLNAKSAGVVTDPQISSREKEILDLAIGTIISRIAEPEDTARHWKDIALEVGSIDEWIDGIRASMAPRPR